MQNSQLRLSSTGVSLEDFLATERKVWKRHSRLVYARLMQKFAMAKDNANDVAFWRAVVHANSYDHEDKLRKQPRDK